MRQRLVATILGLLVVAACSESTSPTTKRAIQVTIVTTGIDVDQDGYLLSLDQQPSTVVPVNDTLTVEARDGNHTIALTGLAANCFVGGQSQHAVTVGEGRSAEASFAVICGSVTGVVRVEAQTVGDQIDPDGYLANISSPAPGNATALLANGFVTIPGLARGTYQVTLSGIEPSCVVAGGVHANVTVRTGQLSRDTALANFQVSCLGSIAEITAPTTGADRDLAYTISIDGGPPITLQPTASLEVSVEAGAHTFLLGDLAGNCTVQGPNPVTVTLGQGSRSVVVFPVHCVQQIAAVRISAVMTGGSQDTTVRVGVDLTCDYWYYYCTYLFEGPLTPNDSVLVVMAPGLHQVDLLGLATNCAVVGGLSRSFNIPVGDTLDVVFTIACSPTGTVRVTTPTTGAHPDDAYLLFLDDRGGVGLLADEAYKFEAVPVGQHMLTLSDVSPACQLAGANPITFTVSADATTDVVYQVTCDPDATLLIAAPTTGGDLDTSYLAFVDNWSGPGILVPANGSVAVQVYSGLHTVDLTSLNFNCFITVSHPVPVSVPAGGEGTATIPVSCARYTGTARITITTTGPNPPSSLNLDYNCDWYYGCSRIAVPANGVASVDLSPGSYLFSFASIPSNCTISPATAVQLSIAAGATADAIFTLVCH